MRNNARPASSATFSGFRRPLRQRAPPPTPSRVFWLTEPRPTALRSPWSLRRAAAASPPRAKRSGVVLERPAWQRIAQETSRCSQVATALARAPPGPAAPRAVPAVAASPGGRQCRRSSGRPRIPRCCSGRLSSRHRSPRTITRCRIQARGALTRSCSCCRWRRIGPTSMCPSGARGTCRIWSRRFPSTPTPCSATECPHVTSRESSPTSSTRR
mmetsp:Transcript_112535/g.317843  ORF Transcript_112535/g.317843 Transcript_112535/m.317843 type:complete len:214 (+) Transcript_112535:749-1390(+)